MRATLPALLLALITAAPALGAPGTLELRARLADALYLESGMGDVRSALAVYQEIATAEQAPADLAGEALYRQALAHAALGEPQEAEATWLRLMDLYPAHDRAADALLRLDRLEQERRRVGSLPLRFAFDRDLEGLFHARALGHRGQLEHRLLDGDDGLQGVAAWRTWVTGEEDDRVTVGLAPELVFQGEITVEVRVETFPAHLALAVVDLDGRDFVTAPAVVQPGEGSVRLSWSASDLRQGDDSWRPGAAARLELRDATGRRSTDRGENVILLDELVAR